MAPTSACSSSATRDSQRWRRAEIVRLRRWGTRFAELAEKLGRTEAAVRRKWQRLRVGREGAKWSLQYLARCAGYDRSVVVRVAHALGVSWMWNGRQGRGSRRWLSPADAEAVLQRLALGTREWSRYGDGCRRCGEAERSHYARGLCRRCYRRERRGGARMKK
jgi:hypothetical protein